MRKIYLLSILFLLLSRCQYDPFANQYLTVKPTDAQVVGVYKFDFQTLDCSSNKEKIEERNSRVIIRDNRTYEILDFPYFEEVGVLTYEFDKHISAKGSWKIEAVGMVDYGNGKRKNYWGLILEGAPKELNPAGLVGEEEPTGLIFSFGDPDDGKVIRLKKG